MKTLILSLCLLGTALAAPITYTLHGPARASFNFRVTLVPVPGESRQVQAQVTFDPENPQTIEGKVLVDLRQLKTGIALRDDHARNFLGVKKFPQAEFVPTKLLGLSRLQKGQKANGEVEGTFKVNGIARSLKAPIEVQYDGTQLQVTTHFDVVLRDHDIRVPGADERTDVKVQFHLKPR